MKLIRKSSHLLLLVVLVALLATSCKSRKKQAELAAAEKAKMEQEAKLKQQQADAEAKAKAEAEAKIRQDADAAAAARNAKESTPAVRLNDYFSAIAAAPNASAANSSISEALSLFESPETPVLIIISQEGDQKDYDKPTTIKSYLNYLKDQKKNVNKIDNLGFNGSGKINALELKKN